MIWQCKVDDGVYRYFESKAEADFFANDTAAAGFKVVTSPIPQPKTSKEFVAFCESMFACYRKWILMAKGLTD